MHNPNADPDDDNSSEQWIIPYMNIIAVVAIQFLLSVPILCYGVYLTQFFLQDSYSLRDSLWTAILFTGSYKIINPWAKSYCKHLQLLKRKEHKCHITGFALILCASLIVLGHYHTQINTMIFYGISGGTCSSIISVHLNFVTAESFRHRPQLFVILDTLAKGLCLLFMPHVILFLIKLHGSENALNIMSTIVCNIIPVCFIIGNRQQQTTELYQCQTLNKSSGIPSCADGTSSSSDEEDEEHQETVVQVQVERPPEEEPQPEVSSNVQKYHQSTGALADIPEESSSQDDDDINEISSKRLSRVSGILQEINVSQRHRDSNPSVINFYQPEDTIETIPDSSPEAEEPAPEPVQIEKSEEESFCWGIISPSIVYNLKLTKRRFKTFCFQNFGRSVPRTLKTLYFYPALVSSSITTTLSTIIFATTPSLTILTNKKTQPEDSTYLLSALGFTWLFFAIGYPAFNKMSLPRKKIFFLGGLSILGLSLFILHRFKHDNSFLFALAFGLGYGMTTYAEDTVNEDFFGEEKWKLLKGALDICTGIIVILIYLVIYFSNLDIHTLWLYAYWIYVFDVGLWVITYTIKRICFCCKNTRRYGVQRYLDMIF